MDVPPVMREAWQNSPRTRSDKSSSFGRLIISLHNALHERLLLCRFRLIRHWFADGPGLACWAVLSGSAAPTALAIVIIVTLPLWAGLTFGYGPPGLDKAKDLQLFLGLLRQQTSSVLVRAERHVLAASGNIRS